MKELLFFVGTFIVVLPFSALIMARILEGPDRYLSDVEMEEIRNSKEV